MSARPALRTASLAARRLASSAPPPPTASSSSSSTTPPLESTPRIYGPRKAFLHAYYSHLFRTSQLVLLFSHDNLSVSNLLSIRRAIAKLPIPPPPFSIEGPTHTQGEDEINSKATLTIARTGLLSSIFPETLPSDSPSLRPHLSGPTALITSPTLSPPYLSKLLLTITREIRKAQKEVPPNTPPEKVRQPKLQLVAGIMEGGRFLGVKEVESVGKLPEMDVLRAQVVGLLEESSRGLLGVLGQARGGGLVRTLQGLEAGLKEGEGGEVTKPE